MYGAYGIKVDSRDFNSCEFENNNDHVLIQLRNYGRHDYVWTTTYKIDGNGGIEFYEWTEGFWEYDENDNSFIDIKYRITNINGELKYSGNFGNWAR